MNSQIKSNTRTKVMSDTPKNQPKSSAKSPHPFVSDEKIKAYYYTDCRTCKNETKWRADVTGAMCTVCCTFVPRDSIGVAPPEEPVPVSVPDSQASDPSEKPAEPAAVRKSIAQLFPRMWPVKTTERKPIDRILELLDVETQEDPIGGGPDRALWCLLSRRKNRLPPMDATFRRRFLHEAVPGNDDADTAIYYLLQNSRRFWRIFAAVLEEVRSASAHAPGADGVLPQKRET